MVFTSAERNLIQKYSEKVVAYREYPDVKGISPISNDTDARFNGRICAQHKTLNQRLKQFSILKNPFRHLLSMHATSFYAVANVIQLCLSTEPFFWALVF